MKINTVIYVEPVGKARARTFKTKSGKYHSYTPKGTAHAENLIRDKLLELYNSLEIEGGFPEKTPIRLEATFYRVKPKSTPKRVTLPATRPDIDNYFKLLTDSLERFIYHNDSQITTAVIRKRFSSPPRIELVLEDDE